MPKYGLKFWYFYVVAAIRVSPGSHIGRKMWHKSHSVTALGDIKGKKKNGAVL